MKWIPSPLNLVVALVLAGSRAASAAEPVPKVLGLDAAVRIALAQQPTMLQARAFTEAASGRRDQAQSGYLPQVTGSALYERIHGNVTSRTSTVGVAGVGTPPVTTSTAATYDVFSVGVNATQLLYDFGQTTGRIRAASASQEAQRAAEATARLQVELSVRHAFFQAHAERALVQVGEETVANQKRHLAQIRGFVEQGIRPEIDLAQARTDLANSEVTLINATTGYATARAQLNQAMGATGPADFDVADEDMAPVPGEEFPTEDLVRSALRNRPELATLLRQQKAAELTRAAIEGAYGPTLAALGGVSEAGPTLGTLGTNWNVGVNLNWPLFQGGLTRGQVREARANIDAATASLSQEQLAVRVQIEQAALAVRAAKVVISAARDATVNARERLRLAEGRYESGVGSIIELDDAQLAVANAGAQLVQAEYSLGTARADLLSALGK